MSASELDLPLSPVRVGLNAAAGPRPTSQPVPQVPVGRARDDRLFSFFNRHPGTQKQKAGIEMPASCRNELGESSQHIALTLNDVALLQKGSASSPAASVHDFGTF